MFIRRKNSVAIAVASSFAVSALFAASALAATTVGDWENNNNEGWFDWTASNGGSDNGGNPGGTPATHLPPSVYSYTSEGHDPWKFRPHDGPAQRLQPEPLVEKRMGKR